MCKIFHIFLMTIAMIIKSHNVGHSAVTEIQRKTFHVCTVRKYMTQHSLDNTSVISSPSKLYPLRQMFRLGFKSEAALHLEPKWPQMNCTAQNARQLCIKQKQSLLFSGFFFFGLVFVLFFSSQFN